MKKTLLLPLFFVAAILLFSTCLHAQSVAINADSSAADPSAILDLKSTVKGFLAPRMTQSQRNAIKSPAPGLLIYQTDNTPGYYCYNGSVWNPIGGSGGSGGGPDTSSGGNFWSLKNGNIYNSNTGFVGIGTDSPVNHLQVGKFSALAGYDIAFGRGPYYTALYQDSSIGSSLYYSSTDIRIFPGNGNGTVAINATPVAGRQNMLQVGDISGTALAYNNIAFGNNGQGSALNQADNAMQMESSTDMDFYPQYGTGHFGINALLPINNTFQIGNTAGYNGNDIAFGNSGQAAGLAQKSNVLQVASTTDILFAPQTGVGHVGINSSLPINNKLQIGNPGTFSFNDIAFGNGTQATGIAQTPNILQVASTTDISFLPQNGTNNGRVGINTTAPQAPLDVESFYTVPERAIVYSALSEFTFNNGDNLNQYFINTANGIVPNISILASKDVYANEFDAYSDRRIKNIIGASDGIKDLRTVNALHIRDYTMKDKMQYCNRRFKKVIAQELEAVDPDLVSKHIDFIPNVYQVTDSVTKTEGGWLLHFQHEHHLGDTARKLKALLAETGNLQSFDIVAIPSPNEVIINAPDIKTNRVFVYGEQVPDFRTVDYEGLTTLNISATQEISREVDELKKALAAANDNIRILAQAVKRVSRPRTANHLAVRRYTASTHIKSTKRI